MANVLQIGVDQVKNAVSVYCRLGFARKKNADLDASLLHPSWNDLVNYSPQKNSLASPGQPEEDPLLAELAAALAELGTVPNETEGNMNYLNRLLLNESNTIAELSSYPYLLIKLFQFNQNHN